MLKDLETFLYSILPKPRVELFVSAVNELEEMQFNYGVGEVYQLWSGSPEGDTASMIDQMDLILRRSLTAVIQRYGITVKQLQLPDLVMLTKRLRHVDESIEHEVIMEIIDKDDDDILRVSELLAIPFGESWIKFIDLIYYVNDEYFERVEQFHNVENGEFADPPDLSLLKRFVGMFKNTFAERLVKDHGKIPGIDIHVAVDCFRADFAKYCPDYIPKAALELVGLCILSGAGYDDVTKVAKIAAEKVYHEPDFLTKLSVEVSRVLSGVPRNG